MASPGNQHCANCIGTLSFPTELEFTCCEHALIDGCGLLPANRPTTPLAVPPKIQRLDKWRTPCAD